MKSWNKSNPCGVSLSIVLFLIFACFSSLKAQDRNDFLFGVGGSFAKTSGSWSKYRDMGVGGYVSGEAMLAKHLTIGAEYRLVQYQGVDGYANLGVHVVQIKVLYYAGKPDASRFYAGAGMSMNMTSQSRLGIVPTVGYLIKLTPKLKVRINADYNFNDMFANVALNAGIIYIVNTSSK